MNLPPVNWLHFRCPCGDSIPLPHESPSERYEGQPYQSKAYWPIAFLCRKNGRVYEGYAEEIDLRPAQKPYRDSARTPLWGIEVRCAHEGCETKKTIYARHHVGDTTGLVIAELLKTDDVDPIFACTAHHRPIREEDISARLLKF